MSVSRRVIMRFFPVSRDFQPITLDLVGVISFFTWILLAFCCARLKHNCIIICITVKQKNYISPFLYLHVIHFLQLRALNTDRVSSTVNLCTPPTIQSSFKSAYYIQHPNSTAFPFQPAPPAPPTQSSHYMNKPSYHYPTRPHSLLSLRPAYSDHSYPTSPPAHPLAVVTPPVA